VGQVETARSALGNEVGQVRKRILTHLSSGVRMIETPDPANCAFCLENYYSVCPVQGTKDPCEEAVSSARHREALALPPSGHP
jgi:hypothetical protein